MNIEIKEILNSARGKASRAVNYAIVEAYWNIGKMIYEEEQNGAERANYGDYLIKTLSKELKKDFGKGLSVTNLKYMRQFYKAFQKSQTLSAQLSWSHYLLLSKIKENDKKEFYFNEAINSKWSVRELERQISSLLFERLTLSKDKNSVMEIAQKGHEINHPKDLVKDPYVLEFLG